MSKLIKALQNPKLYPHKVSGFKLIQTHISWVILTGTYAYKIKKPVDFGFLDFTTLERRKYFCELELKLNQKLSSDLYLQVVPITGDLQNPQLGGSGEIIEYALQMREFAQENLLSSKAASLTQIKDLAQIMANFHQQTLPVKDGKFLTVAAALAPLEQNFSQIRPLLTQADDLANLAQLEQKIRAKYAQIKAALNARIKSGAIKECHGDVHLGNIVQDGDKPLIFDCIEFNDDFRLIDVISDLAFLVMDLADRKQQNLAHILLSDYLAQTLDYQGLSVLNFYLTHRALVRAKVNLFSLNHGDAAQIMQNYRNYLTLACQYQQPKKPFLAIMFGVSGSGKSFVAEEIVAKFGAICLSSDNLRRQKGNKDYSSKGRAQIYQELFSQAELVLQNGFAAIIDATFLNSNQRDQALQLAQKWQVPLLIVACEASMFEIEQRLNLRAQNKANNSDATIKVVRKQLQTLEPLSLEEQKISIKADANLLKQLKNWLANF